MPDLSRHLQIAHGASVFSWPYNRSIGAVAEQVSPIGQVHQPQRYDATCYLSVSYTTPNPHVHENPHASHLAFRFNPSAGDESEEITVMTSVLGPSSFSAAGSSGGCGAAVDVVEWRQ